MMGFISKFILPKDSDFDSALVEQTEMTLEIVQRLQQVCATESGEKNNQILDLASQAREIKTRNMKELLDVFIAPYDKESIFRIITQLDWIVLSVKHFTFELEAYGMPAGDEYQVILTILTDMAIELKQGVKLLSGKDIKLINESIRLVHDQYDSVVEHCAMAKAELLKNDDLKYIIKNQTLIDQLKEVSRRIQMAANTLEDMAIKIV